MNNKIISILEKYYSPAYFDQPKSLIEKYKIDFKDDFIVEILFNAINSQNESYWLDGKYDNELSPISKKIDDLRIKYNLKKDEDFSNALKQAPLAGLVGLRRLA